MKKMANVEIPVMTSKRLEKKLRKICKEYNLFNQSPYSNSFYNTDEVEWGYKPEGSLRLSDHWNFESQERIHCKLSNTNEYTQKWLLCEYHEGYYTIVKEIFTEEEMAMEKRMHDKKVARINKLVAKQDWDALFNL